jgi:hypothetical protein
LLDHPEDLSPISNIAVDSERCSTLFGDLRDNRIHSVFRARGYDDFCAGSSEGDRDAAADASPCARDNGDFSVEISHRSPSFPLLGGHPTTRERIDG